MSTESLPTQVHTVVRGPLQRHTHTYDLMRQCIHCGFCLPTCPTYAVLGVEMDSPRGRIYQMQAVADGRLEVSDDFIEHMNCCVGCRACETACPSGVQFGKLIEAAREQIQLETTGQITVLKTPDAATTPEYRQSEPTTQPTKSSIPATLLRRFFFEMMLPSRPLLNIVFGGLKLYQRSGLEALVHRTGLLDFANGLPTPFQGQLKVPEELMHGARGEIVTQKLAEVTPAIGTRLYRVGFISGCIMDQVFRDINEATIRVLTANGCEVITPQAQNCCGALHIHGGEAEKGRELARHNIDVFAAYDCDLIIINSAGCGSTLKEYDHLLRDDPDYAQRAKVFSGKMKDISEFLASIEWQHDLGEVVETVAYHDACHLLHGQKIKLQPRQILKAIPGVTMVDLKESDWCCGSAGVYNITNQEMGKELLERKINNIATTGARIIATGNPGCMMQIAMGVRQRGLPMNVVHPVELLDKAYQAGGIYQMPTKALNQSKIRRNAFFASLAIGFVAATLLARRRQGTK